MSVSRTVGSVQGNTRGVSASALAGAPMSSGDAGRSEEFRRIVEILPIAIYTTDADGCITFYNEAAATLWGRWTRLQEDRWCGTWRLHWLDGTPMPPYECPMAVTLTTGRPVRDVEAIAE